MSKPMNHIDEALKTLLASKGLTIEDVNRAQENKKPKKPNKFDNVQIEVEGMRF